MSVATARPIPANQADGPSPRKRRKRAPAAGAADDCFTCSSRGYKCDRRRPYCSQCLDEGKDCAGYKTQLTWGVGVASRGKLRGLSLPVAGTKKAVPAPKARHRQSVSVSSIATQEVHPTPISIPSPASSRSNTSIHRDKHSISPPVNSPFPPTWETPVMPQHSTHGYHNGMLAESPISPMAFTFPPNQATFSPVERPQHFGGYRHDRMHSMHSVYPSPASDGPIYTQATSETLYAEAPPFSRPPPLSIPIPPPQTQYGLAPFTPFDTAFDRVSPHVGTFFAQAGEAYVTDETQQSYSGDAKVQPVSASQEQPNFTREACSEVLLTVPEEDYEVEEIPRTDASNKLVTYHDAGSPVGLGLHIPNSFNGSFQNIGMTPRLQYLINYYAEVITPVIVAFDSPSNPFRTHILRLATKSEALQHAVGALAASNLRQRRSTGVLSTCKTDTARRSSLAHLTLSRTDVPELWDQQHAAQEETALKNHAIALLNQQLSQPVERLQDSALAVLLILCLFHMCDTGVAKFSTQFKGVRKLLALRKASGSRNSVEAEFCTRMFAWWDGVTSSVNEREGVFGNGPLPPTVAPAFEHSNGDSDTSSWSLECLAGIDSGLFRVVSRLGRLNLLAQGENVEKDETMVSRPPELFGRSANNGGDAFDLGQQYLQFDGNGWFPLPQHSRAGSEDRRSELFHRELAETQHLLAAWSPPKYTDASPLSMAQQQDVVHISMTFYFATQLYLLRLRHPSAPSASPQIQALVQATLTEVQKVKADVYLLWPLFVAGSECTTAQSRESVLRRVREIQGDSGFVNNGVIGGVLEGVWSVMDAEAIKVEEDIQGMNSNGMTAQGFRWAEVMRRGGGLGEARGEYIVV